MPTIKYHYTSVDGMTSIMKSRQLRLTRSEFLNDPSDSKVLFVLLKKYLEYQDATIKAKLTPVLRQLYEIAPLIDYIDFLQKHIHLYVLSLTDNSDQMSMWNYYGSGGMELSIDIEELIGELRKSLKTDNQYLAYSPIQYISETDDVSSISFSPFCDFHLDSKNKENIFYVNSTKRGQNGSLHPLYKTTELKGFIETYITGYIQSLTFLSGNGTISIASTPEDIFKAVHNNTNSLNNYYEFKKDLTLYMIVLSALIKSETYSYEKEFRLVVFENTLAPSLNVQYGVQNLHAQKYVRPYFETDELDTSFIKAITLSPLTRNLPIDSRLYVETIADFINSTSTNNMSIVWSRHKIRW